MLQKFLFVGLGGSGGKTLRFLYEDLRRRLDAVRWEGELPRAWQFLHIDVPVTADGVSPDLPAQLSRRSYVGLAPYGMSYVDLDDQLARQGAEVLEYAAAWRPSADRVGIVPAIGAGQFRAVGRSITAASLHIIVGRIKAAVDALKDVAIDEELSRAAMLLTGSGELADRAPQVVLVSSIAGGSGAGSVLDVADVLRHSADPWGGEAVGLLYLPDVFSDVPDAQRSGVTANALATVSELINAFYATGEQPEWEGRFPLLEANGMNPEAGPKRGPRYPFLVGRSNGELRYATQNEVYRAVAQSLASWMTNEHVQDQMHVALQGNWAATAEAREDLTRLAAGPGREVPFSAMGFASVGLGRERFARYASERLAAHAVDHLLRAHHTDEVRDDRLTPDEAAAQRAAAVRHQFVERCELKELGPADNQIIDALRGGTGKASRRDHLQELRAALTDQVIGTGQHEADAGLVLLRALSRYKESEPRVVGDIFEADAGRARQWAESVQDQVLWETARVLGQEGARVTELVIIETIHELRRAVVPELRHEAQSARAFAAQNDERVRGRFAGITGKIRAGENPAVAGAIEECIDSAYAQAEARMLDLAATLVLDLADNFLQPLVDALVDARRSLVVEDEGTVENPSIVKGWSRGPVPRQVKPAQNEILLEEADAYPEVFLSRVRATVGEPDVEGALYAAIRQVIGGENPAEPAEPATAVSRSRNWVPGDPSLSITRPPTKASFRFDLAVEDLLRRATNWIYTPGTAVSAYIGEPLKGYLDPHATDPQTHAARLERFRVGLHQALKASRPLVQLDPGREVLVHGAPGGLSEVITPFPFHSDHPGRKIVYEVLHTRSEDQLGKLFDEDEKTAIEITTFLAGPCQPPVIQSLFEPIKVDWARRSGQPNQAGFWDRRRTRPLTEFVPMPADLLLATVRGWHVARLLNWVEVKELNRAPVQIWSEDGWLDFPFPLLGPPLRDRSGLLAGLLESFPLTLLDEPESSMRSYWRLQAMGSEDVQHLVADEAARGGLQRWVETGEVSPGAPKPALQPLEDDRNGRVDAVLEELDRYLKHYRELAGLRVGNGVAVTGMWEIRSVLLKAVVELGQEIEGLREAAQGGVW
jgi:hypothetical protein